jgi:hypothetical protein
MIYTIDRSVSAREQKTPKHLVISKAMTSYLSHQELHHYVTTIQTSVKYFLRKKHEKLVIPQNYKCPITLELFINPVVASDGNTYEFEAIQQVINTTMKSPLTGAVLPSASLFPNLNLRSEIMEFRSANKLFVPEHIPNQPHEHHHPPASPWRPEVSAGRLLRDMPDDMTPFQLLKHDTFLNEIKKSGLMLLWQRIGREVFNPDSMTKNQFIFITIGHLVHLNTTQKDNIITILSEKIFLNHISKDGLLLILKMLKIGATSSGSNDFLRRLITLNFPIKLKIIDEDGTSFKIEITRSMSFQTVSGIIAYKKFQMKIGQGQDLSKYGVCVNMNNGDTINLSNRLPALQPLPDYDRDLGGSQVFVKPSFLPNITITVNITSSTTVYDFQQMLINIPSIRTFFTEHEDADYTKMRMLVQGTRMTSGTVMENLIASSSIEVGVGRLVGMTVQETTIQLTLPQHGGMPPKGVRKLTKAQKSHEMRARASYSSMRSPTALQIITQQRVTQPNFIQNAIQNMSLPHLQEVRNIIDGISRSDRIPKAIVKFFIPQIQTMLDQQDQITDTITALEDTFEVVFMEAYYDDKAYNTDPFYEAIYSKVDEMTTEAEVQRRLTANTSMED